jgi:Poxvirus A32 protein
MPPRKKKVEDELPTGGVINWYEKMPKEMLDKAENPNKHIHGIDLPFRMCVSAPSGSGKTNFLLNLIHLFSKGEGSFADITIITRNKDEPAYNYLTSKCDQIQIKEGLHNIPPLDKMDKKANHLVCFDDLILAKDQSPIINYYIRARKLNCSVCYLSQSFFDIPPIIRKNCSYMVFMKIGGLREIKTILRDFSLNCTKDQLIGMYDYATEQKLSPFIIDIEEKDRMHKFRKGFNEYMNPQQYGPDET